MQFLTFIKNKKYNIEFLMILYFNNTNKNKIVIQVFNINVCSVIYSINYKTNFETHFFVTKIMKNKKHNIEFIIILYFNNRNKNKTVVQVFNI